MRALSFGLLTLLLCFAARAAEAPAAARPADATPSAIELLLRTARYWQAKGREDRAAEALQKVLRSDPAEPEALAALGSYYARSGKPEKARELLERLRKGHPGHPEVLNLSRAIGVGKDFDELLSQARALAKAKKVEEAAAAYRRLMGELPPPRHLALEYYQTLGGAKDGFKEAREGLTALLAKSPGEPTYRFALARLLSYREETRREAIELLFKLEGEPEVGTDAAAALRQSVLWLHVGDNDDGIFKAYLARHPQDEAVAKRRADNKRAPAKSPLLGQGFAALQKGEEREAERLFELAAKGAINEPEASVGLGTVALQRKQFERARVLLERARAAAPDRQELWGRSLKTATFFSLYEKARAAREADKLDEAEDLLQQAGRASPEEATLAAVGLAELALDRGDVERAEQRLLATLKDHPADPAALRMLVQVLLRAGRGEEAQAANERLRKADPAQAFKPGWVEAERRRARAAALKKEGRLEAARAELLGAHDADPTHLWALHDLADFHVLMGELKEARAAVAKLLALSPDLPASKIVNARLLATEGETARALEALAGLPGDQLDEELLGLRRRLQFQAEIDRVVRRALAGRREVARQELLALQERAHGDARKQAVIGMAWAAISDFSRAIAALVEAAEAQDPPPPEIRLQLASVLLRADRPAQLTALLTSLHNDPRLTPREQRDLSALRVAHAVRRADRFRDEAEFPLAYAQLQPMLAERPNDPKLLNALGRLFQSAGRPEDGQLIFARLVQEDPDDLEARQGAVDGALRLRDEASARKLLDEAVRRAPEDPRIQLLAGRFEVRIGRDGEALDRFRQAQALIESAASEAPAGGPAPGPLGADVNTEAILTQAARLFSPAERSGRAVIAEGGALQVEIQDEIEQVRSRHAVDVSGASELRRRDGVDGLGALMEFRFPLEVRVPAGYSGRFALQVVPTSLDAGRLDFSDPFAGLFFGTGVANTASSARQERGTALDLAYTRGGLSIDVGSSPLGFAVKNVLGGLGWHGELGSVGLSLSGSRRAVTDSLLSYAGEHDPISGTLWGGVVKNAGRADLAFLTPNATYYVYGGYALYTGVGVPKNQALDGGLGIEWKLYDRDATSLVTGVALAGQSFEKNERYFTLGHGGYFSPAAMVRAGIPFKAASSIGKLRWDVAANAGVNWFRESKALYFPLDGGLQAAREAAVDKNGDALPFVYGERTNLSFALDARAHLSYAITSQLEGGAFVEVHRADDFQELSTGLFLRFSFRGKAGAGAREPRSSADPDLPRPDPRGER